MTTINTDESQNVEFKESWNDKYLQWICGFANAQGGRIYIGVNDSREVVVGFYLAGLIESWGHGYFKIRSGFESAGLRVPTFDVVRGGVLATIEREMFVKQNYDSSSNVPSSDNLVVSSDNLVASSGKKEWESYKDICERIIGSTVEWTSLNEISHNVGRNPKYLRNKIIPRMISEGKLQLKYPDTPKHPNQKYRGINNN